MSDPLYKISYGLYVLTARENSRDNGCIINTAQLVTTTPNRISVTVNKANLTHDMIVNTGIFNVNILTVDTPQSIFEHFGYQSGKNVDKFADAQYNDNFSENGVRYLPKYINAYISGKVVQSIDLGTHTMFIADVTATKSFSDDDSVTYDYYQKNIKPQPKVESGGKTKWVCKICGYIYEGDKIPADFVCPLCKHGASDFEKVEEKIAEPTRYKCKICGYIYEGDELPEDFTCPICKRGAEDFEKI